MRRLVLGDEMPRQQQELTAHMLRLLDIVRGLYGWASRLVIAEKLGKKQLSSYDVLKLEKLAARGLIEIRKTRGIASRGYIFEYRLIEPEERDTMVSKDV